jgi:hypothetical protein
MVQKRRCFTVKTRGLSAGNARLQVLSLEVCEFLFIPRFVRELQPELGIEV